MIKVSVSAHNSSRRWRSAELRARRDTSSPRIAPTSPTQTRPTSSLKPDRADAVRPETPRSASITEIRAALHPSRAASSASAYWRAVDSVCSRTWAIVDWRTYTTASRSRWVAVILLAALIGPSSGERGLDHVRHDHHHVPLRHHGGSVQLAAA